MTALAFESAYEGVTKKGTKVLILTDTQGNRHYIELEAMTKYNVYTGKPYKSKEHRAYTFNNSEETPDETPAI